MDIRHIQKVRVHPGECAREQSPVWTLVRAHPRECSQEQYQVWKLSSPDERALHELQEKIDWSRNLGRKFKLGQSLTKWFTVVTNEILRERIQTHPPVQVPSLNDSERLKWILMSRGFWITVHHCAKKKNTSIICIANLHSLPWNITSMAHKIRTTLKRRWTFKPASGNRCHHDVGKTRPPRKAAAAAAAAAGILCQYIRGESPTTEKKSAFERTEFGLWFLDDIRGEDFLRDERLQVCLLRHHDRRHSEEARAKLIGKRIHVCGLVALPLPQKLQFCKLGEICSIRRPWADYSSKNDYLRKKILTRVQFIYSVDWARNHYFIAEAGLEIVRVVYPLVQKENKHFAYNGECTICLDNSASEAEVNTDTKKSRKVNHQINWRPEQNAKDWIYLSATQKRILAHKV